MREENDTPEHHRTGSSVATMTAIATLSDEVCLVARQLGGDVQRIMVSLDGSTVEVEWAMGQLAASSSIDPALPPEGTALPPEGTAPPPNGTAAPPPNGTALTGGQHVTAPTVGLFHDRPETGRQAYVQPGQPVEPETVVGMIESMRIRSPITAGIGGTVTRVLVEDATMIQYDQPLFEIEPRVLPAGAE